MKKSITESMSTKEIEKQLKERKKEEKEQIRKLKREEKIMKNEEWMWDFDFDEKGKLLNSIRNYVGIFEKCPDLGTFSYDTYKNKRVYKDSNGKEYEFSDSLYRKFYEWTEQYLSPCDRRRCEDGLLRVSDKNSYNSSIDLLDSLVWDGVPRVDTFFIDILGSPDTPLIREMTRKWLVGSVQRLYEPGCKNENLLILTGRQGCGKTQTLMWLSGGLGFDNNVNLGDSEKETGMKLDRCWFVCFDELSTLSKRQSSEIKNWLSIQEDTYRVPYGHVPSTRKRHNVYCGTTNDTEFLKDYSDSTERRMWVVPCTRTQEEFTKEYFQKLTPELWKQIYGECVHIYKTTPDFCPYLSVSSYQEFNEHQKQYKDYNSGITDLLLEYLNKPYYLDKNGSFEDVNDMLNQMKNGRESCGRRFQKSIQYLNHIPQSYVSIIVTELLKQKRVDHNCLRYSLDGKWCVKKNKCRIGDKNLKFYIRGEWNDINNDTVQTVSWVYDDKEEDTPYYYDENMDLILTGGDTRCRVYS